MAMHVSVSTQVVFRQLEGVGFSFHVCALDPSKVIGLGDVMRCDINLYSPLLTLLKLTYFQITVWNRDIYVDNLLYLLYIFFPPGSRGHQPSSGFLSWLL